MDEEAKEACGICFSLGLCFLLDPVVSWFAREYVCVHECPMARASTQPGTSFLLLNINSLVLLPWGRGSACLTLVSE